MKIYDCLRSSLSLCSIILLASCSNINPHREKSVNRLAPNQSINQPSNVEKVLNNVLCIDCSQNQVDALWNACLDRGYVTSSPTGRVISSREISELVSQNYSYYVDEHHTVLQEDPSGVVLEKPQIRKVMRHSIVKGHCRGSEYIMQ